MKIKNEYIEYYYRDQDEYINSHIHECKQSVQISDKEDYNKRLFENAVKEE